MFVCFFVYTGGAGGQTDHAMPCRSLLCLVERELRMFQDFFFFGSTKLEIRFRCSIESCFYY